jgi:hypothetical protein
MAATRQRDDSGCCSWNRRVGRRRRRSRWHGSIWMSYDMGFMIVVKRRK